MDLLITLLGNVAVDPSFRERFLKDPVDTADEYGFRMTKGEFELMKTVFADLTPMERNALEGAFAGLQDLLYKSTNCHPPCAWSVYPPPEPHELRKALEKPEKARELKKRGKAA